MREQRPHNPDLGGEIARRQLVAWLAPKWINPDAGETVVDEYVRSYVHGGGVAARIRQAKELVHGRTISAVVGTVFGPDNASFTAHQGPSRFITCIVSPVSSSAAYVEPPNSDTSRETYGPSTPL